MNHENLMRLIAAVEASTDFNMREHCKCIIGHAAKLEGKEIDCDFFPAYGSDDLAEFLGIDLDYPKFLDMWSFTQRTQAEAVAMLKNFEATGEVKW